MLGLLEASKTDKAGNQIKKIDQYFYIVVLNLSLSIAPKSVTIQSEGYCIRQSSDEWLYGAWHQIYK